MRLLANTKIWWVWLGWPSRALTVDDTISGATTRRNGRTVDNTRAWFYEPDFAIHQYRLSQYTNCDFRFMPARQLSCIDVRYRMGIVQLAWYLNLNWQIDWFIADWRKTAIMWIVCTMATHSHDTNRIPSSSITTPEPLLCASSHPPNYCIKNSPHVCCPITINQSNRERRKRHSQPHNINT